MKGQITLDPLTLSLIEGRLDSFNNELCLRTMRQCFSTAPARLRDLGSALFDKDGRVVAHANFGPPHAAGADIALKGMLDWIGRDNIQPDDFLIGNDPFIVRSGHAPDWSFIRPVFYNGEVIFYHYMRTHQFDSGGAFPGSYAVRSYDCHAEGLMIPPVKIIEKGVIDEKTYSIILRNVRNSDLVRADNLLIYGSMRKCEERILDMVKSYGTDVIRAACEEIIRKNEVLVRKEISTWKAGVYRIERASDWDGTTDKPVWVRLTLTVKPKEGELIFDFSESDPLRIFVNCPYARWYASLLTATRWALSNAIHSNQAVSNCIKTIAKDGTVLGPVYPATSAGQGPIVGTSVFECCQLALNMAVPKEQTQALWHRLFSPILAGKLRDKKDPTKTTKNYFAQTFASASGSGAVWGYDGGNWAGGPMSGRGSTRAPIESFEAEMPYRWLRHEIVTDSAGDGRWRGGTGVHVEYLNLHDPKSWEALDCLVETGSSDGEKFPPLGALGGRPGKNGKMWIKRGAKRIHLRTVDTQYVQPGDIIMAESGGGGGVGNPHERDVEKVRWDVVNEYISMAKARKVYGVVLDPKTFEIDHKATARLRGKRPSGKIMLGKEKRK